MRYLITAAAIALCTSVAAQSVKLDTDSPVTVSSTIESHDSSSVTSSVDAGSGVTTSSIVGRNGSMCHAVVEGRRCEITCQAPRVAQCGKAVNQSEPSCVCK